jgi:hypothetical protein
MAVAGWLQIQDTHIIFPRFERHNSETSKKRAEDRDRQQRSRANRDRSVTDVTHECDKNVTIEKRREEYIPNRTEAAEGGYSNLPKTAVRQPSTLLAWFHESGSSVDLRPSDLRHVIAAAVRIGAMPDAKNHAALLVDAIRTRRWHVIEPEHYAQADAWLASHGGTNAATAAAT